MNMLLPTRDVFISFDNGDMVDTSGYASVGSYTDSEPNVVFVFAKYMSTWNNVDSEGRYRDLLHIIAMTASHEAGHALGLEHHGNYDIGNNITTPILGSNVQGDRSIWSSYYVGETQVDSKAHLTGLLGARPDEYAETWSTAQNFPLCYSPLRGYSGTVSGVIGTNDTDVFRLNTSATNTYRFTVSVPQFGNLDSQLVISRVRTIRWLGYTMIEQIAVVDPAISAYNPFSGLGATIDVQLPAGNYTVAVRSHGGYGDVGRFSLTVSIPSSGSVYYPASSGVYAMASEPAPSNPLPPVTTNTNTAVKKYAGASNDFEPVPTQTMNTPVSTLNELEVEGIRKKTRQEAVDQVFAAW